MYKPIVSIARNAYMKAIRPIFLILLITYFVSEAAAELPEGFVYIRDEIPNIVEEIRYFGSDNFVGSRVTGYNKPIAILSKEATTALKNVQDELNQFGLGLKIFDSYRPQQSVDHFVRWAKDLNDKKQKQTYYPEVNKQHLFRDGYIAARSSHTRGSTVDLTIVSLTTKDTPELDMGSRWDYFGPASWPSSMVPTKQQRANRMLLQLIMKKHGFRALTTEWWHFTYNDEPFPKTYFDFPVE